MYPTGVPELAIPDRSELAVPTADTLDAAAIDRVRRAPSEHTLLAYRRWVRHYKDWCAARGNTQIPASPQMFANYVSALADEDRGVATIKMAMAAVRWLHALAGHKGHPGNELALLALRTHARERADDGARGGQATPILLPALRAMLDTCPADTLRGRRDRFVLVIGWTAMLRRSELAALTFADVREVPDGLTVYIARSKTDKDAKGADVPLPHGTHPDTDPARVHRSYVTALSEYGITFGRLMRGIGYHGLVGDGMTGDQINDVVKGAARRADLPNADSYSAHSLRAGGATEAYRNGAPVSAIAQHGRWARNSPVVLGYIRSVDKWKDNPMRGIGI